MSFTLNSHDFSEFENWLAPFNAGQTTTLKLFASVFHHNAQSMNAVRDTRQVPKSVREFVLANSEIKRLTVVERRKADDGFVKYLFESPLGGQFEAVRIPLFDTKYVVCVSSQVGCALKCDFCMTGKMGFKRNLQAWEIIEQVQIIRQEAQLPVRGVVFMGMGEPLLNFNETSKAARIMCHPAGLQIAAKAITFSTAGWVPGIQRYLRENLPYRLAFSITSAIPEKRRQVLPVEETHPFETLIACIREYATSRDERAMLAYVLIRDFNTKKEDAEALKRAFDGIPIKIDLIDVTDPTGKYLPPTDEELSRFRSELQILNAPIARRYSGGKDIDAACGTLANSQRGGALLTAPNA